MSDVAHLPAEVQERIGRVRRGPHAAYAAFRAAVLAELPADWRAPRGKTAREEVAAWEADCLTLELATEAARLRKAWG